jgi:ribonuclease BN (tRNA processing enzyme)
MQLSALYKPLFPLPLLSSGDPVLVHQVADGCLYHATSGHLLYRTAPVEAGGHGGASSDRPDVHFHPMICPSELFQEHSTRRAWIAQCTTRAAQRDVASSIAPSPVHTMSTTMDSPQAGLAIEDSPLSSSSCKRHPDPNRIAAASLLNRLAQKRKLFDPFQLSISIGASSLKRDEADLPLPLSNPSSASSKQHQRGFFVDWVPSIDEESFVDQDMSFRLQDAASLQLTASDSEANSPTAKMARHASCMNDAATLAMPIPSVGKPGLVSLCPIPPPNPMHDGFEVTFLGTGCATPSKHRSNSAILLRFLSHGYDRHPIASKERKRRSFDAMQCAATKSLDDAGKLSIDTSFLGEEEGVDADEVNSYSVTRTLTEQSQVAFNSSDDKSLGHEDTSSQQPPRDHRRADDCFILLDCGESVTSQLYQSVQGDLDRFDQILLHLKVIWISHHHADHVTGLATLLQHIYLAQIRSKRKQQRAKQHENSDNRHTDYDNDHFSQHQQHQQSRYHTSPSIWNKYILRQNSGSMIYYDAEKIMIIASEAILKYCECAVTVAGFETLVSFYPITHTLYAGCTNDIHSATYGLVTRLTSVPVQHCNSAFGVVLECRAGQKIVYSGDCRPSQSLVKNGLKCDLLIHEATFSDDRCVDAVKKKHSTYSEALEISRRMQAKYTVLTHFSQRYPLAYTAWQQPTGLSGVGSESSLTGSGTAWAGAGSGTSLESVAGNYRAAMAYDFLHFCYPSQVQLLADATSSIAQVLKRLEESEHSSGSSSGHQKMVPGTLEEREEGHGCPRQGNGQDLA